MKSTSISGQVRGHAITSDTINIYALNSIEVL